jgi:hypothetical protein
MSWHHPDLYLFLCLLTGLATFLAIVYECIQKFRRKPSSTVKAVNPHASEASAIDAEVPEQGETTRRALA